MTLLLLALLPAHASCLESDQDIVVHVLLDGQHVAVDVDCPVDAPRIIVWEVLTDYDHMAHFMSDLQYSAVENRAENVLRVRQQGMTSKGPLTLSFDNIREVQLVPYREIHSRLISGDLKSYDAVTRIVEVSQRLHILNSGSYTPNIWVPPLFGPALIESETQKHFGELRTEIMRRSALLRPQS